MPTNTRNLANVPVLGKLVVAANGNIAIANTTSTIAARLHIEDPVAQAANQPVLIVGDPGGSVQADNFCDGILVDTLKYGFVSKRHSDTDSAQGLITYRSRGTSGAETAVDNNDNLHAISAMGYNGSEYVVGGYTAFRVNETHRSLSGGNIPTEYFLVLNDGTTFNAPLLISPSDTAGVHKTTITGILDVIGTGITLPNGGTQTTGTASSNVLDWYEEGTWTPTFIAGTTNPTSITYAFQQGKYTRIGDVVHFTCHIASTTNGISNDGVGEVYVDGLPFVASNAVSTLWHSCSMGYNFVNDSSGTPPPQPRAAMVKSNDNYLTFWDDEPGRIYYTVGSVTMTIIWYVSGSYSV